jgi:uncharacterized OB-fold protein
MGIYTDKRKSTTTADGYELLMHESGHLEYDFGWHLGPYWSKYLAEMRDNKRIMGVKCPECGMVYVPPRKACGRCYKEMNEWVEVGPEGILKGFTVVRFPYIDPNVGTLMQVPFTAVWINLDGSDTRMMHFCDELDEMKLTVGMRMRAVWAKAPRPTSIHAIDHFEVIPGAAIVEEKLPDRLKGPVELGLGTKKKPARKKAAAKKKKPAAKKKAAPAKKKAAPAKKKAAKKKAAPAKKKAAPARKKAAAKKKAAPARKKAAAKKKAAPARKKPAARKKAPAKKKAAARKR